MAILLKVCLELYDWNKQWFTVEWQQIKIQASIAGMLQDKCVSVMDSRMFIYIIKMFTICHICAQQLCG